MQLKEAERNIVNDINSLKDKWIALLAERENFAAGRCAILKERIDLLSSEIVMLKSECEKLRQELNSSYSKKDSDEFFQIERDIVAKNQELASAYEWGASVENIQKIKQELNLLENKRTTISQSKAIVFKSNPKKIEAYEVQIETKTKELAKCKEDYLKNEEQTYTEDETDKKDAFVAAKKALIAETKAACQYIRDCYRYGNSLSQDFKDDISKQVRQANSIKEIITYTSLFQFPYVFVLINKLIESGKSFEPLMTIGKGR